MAGITSTVLLGLAGINAAKSLFDNGPAAPVLPTAPAPVDMSSAGAAAEMARRRAAVGARRNGTLITGPSGVAPAPVVRKTLLGS